MNRLTQKINGVEVEIEETSIQIYKGDEVDSLRLLHWWDELRASGDMDKVLFPSTHGLGEFINFFHPTSTNRIRLAYVTDDEGKIQLAAWGEPVAHGIIFLSLWARKSIRHTRKGVQMVLDIYNEVFNICTIIFGITKQETLLKVHKDWGYTIASKVPGLWGGVEDGWLMQLTKEDFLAKCEGKGE